MAISFVGSGSGVETPTLPAHQAGDLIVVFAYKGDGAVNIPAAEGYNASLTGFGNQNAQRVGFKIASSANEAGGVWSGATATLALIYRGVDQANPLGATAQFTNLADILYPAITLQVTDGTSHVLAIHGRRGGNVEQPVPPGTTKRGDAGAIAGSRIEGFGSGRVSTWPQLATGGDNGQRYRSVSIELRAGAAPAVEKIAGRGDAVIPSIVGEARGSLKVRGSGSATIAAIVGQGSGRLPVRASGDSWIGRIVGEATGLVSIAGRGDATIAAIVGEAFGALDTAAFGDAAIPSIVGEARARSSIRGFGDAVIAPILGFASGSAGSPAGNFGRGDGVIPSVIGEATARLAIIGRGDAVVGVIIGEARGSIERPPVAASPGRTVRLSAQRRLVRPKAEIRVVRVPARGVVMSQMKWPAKDPVEVLNYAIIWTDRLEGEEIDSVLWEAPHPLAIVEESWADGIAVVVLSGGALGTHPLISCRVTTLSNRVFKESVQLDIVDR